MNARSTTRVIAPVVAALAAVAVLGACSSDDDAASPHEGHGTSSMSMPASSTVSATGHNAADTMFAQMMIPHHEQAVEMSDVLLAKDGVPEKVRQLATGIKQAQAPEVATMTGWLRQWGEPITTDMSGHSMDGMVSAADISKLKNAPGPEAATLYLKQMIGHHEGAVDMARTEIESGSNAEAVALARSVVESQTAEIDEMKSLLAE